MNILWTQHLLKSLIAYHRQKKGCPPLIIYTTSKEHLSATFNKLFFINMSKMETKMKIIRVSPDA